MANGAQEAASKAEEICPANSFSVGASTYSNNATIRTGRSFERSSFEMVSHGGFGRTRRCYEIVWSDGTRRMVTM
jgi:cytidine deaminase